VPASLDQADAQHVRGIGRTGRDPDYNHGLITRCRITRPLAGFRVYTFGHRSLSVRTGRFIGLLQLPSRLIRYSNLGVSAF
jgi:hypothetical protein